MGDKDWKMARNFTPTKKPHWCDWWTISLSEPLGKEGSHSSAGGSDLDRELPAVCYEWKGALRYNSLSAMLVTFLIAVTRPLTRSYFRKGWFWHIDFSIFPQ